MSEVMAYTDGSCKGNPGLTGYGIHMLKTDNEIKPKQVLGKFKTTNLGYLDKKKMKIAKNVEEVGIDKIIDIYGYKEDSNTNNRAELDAITEAIRFIINYKAVDDTFENVNKVIINTDSQYSLNLIEKLQDDVYTIEDIVANRDKAEELDKLLKILKEKNIEIVFRKVEGHSGDLGNDRADMLANLGVKRNLEKEANERIIVKDFKDYWNNEPERPFIFDSKFIFGYSLNNKNYRFRYGLDYGDETEIGKKDNEVAYVVYDVTENDVKTLTELEGLFNKITDTTVLPYVMELRNIFGKETIRNLSLYDKDYLVLEDKIKKKIYTMDDKLLVTEVYPPSLAIYAYDNFDYLSSILQEFKTNKLKNWKIVDITNSFYNVNEKDKLELNKTIKDKDAIKVKVDNYELKIIVGLDTPKRNTLKRLESLNPKVNLLIKEHDTYVEYLTITEYKIEDKNYYVLVSNFYANKIIHR